MPFTCEIKEIPPQPILAVRVRTRVDELPQVFSQWYASIAGYLVELGENPSGAPFAVYYNMDMQDLDMGIGFPVARNLPGKGEITPGEIPGGRYATCLFTGPYSELGIGYDALNQWMTEKGYTPTGVVYEMYLDDPNQTPPYELKTFILFPIQ